MDILFFKSRSNKRYGYDAVSNKILSIPERYKETPELETNLLLRKKQPVFPLVFSKPEQNWLASEDKSIDSIILNITDACNLRCSYCAYSGQYPYERVHSNNFMSIDTAKKSLDFFFQRNKTNSSHLKKISLYGGEPLLATEVVEFVVSYAKEKSPKAEISISTNGTLINSEWIDFFIENNIRLNISLDGDQCSHDRYRVKVNGHGTHKEIIKNLYEIKTANEEFYKKNVLFIATLVPPYKLLYLYNFYNSEELVREQPWYISYIKPLDTNFFEKFAPNPQENLKEYDEQLSLITEHFIDSLIKGENNHFAKWIFGEGLRKIHHRVMNPSPVVWINGCCIPGKNRLFVNTAGDFYPCERSGNFMCIGNINDGFEISSAGKIVNEYAKDCELNCQLCPNVRFCDTCYLGSKTGNKFDAARKYKFCDKRIEKLKTLMYIYTSALESNVSAFDNFSV